MAAPDTALAVYDKSIAIFLEGNGETWSKHTGVAAESSIDLAADTIQVELVNLNFNDGAPITGRARVALTAGGTADGQAYRPLASGEGMIIKTVATAGGLRKIYIRRETTDVTFHLRQMKA